MGAKKLLLTTVKIPLFYPLQDTIAGNNSFGPVKILDSFSHFLGFHPPKTLVPWEFPAVTGSPKGDLRTGSAHKYFKYGFPAMWGSK